MQKRTLEEAKYPHLANWINRNNLSLAKFGELIKLSEKQVWSILKGKARPSVKVVDNICKVTGLTYIHDEKFGDFVNQESFIQSRRNVRLNVGDVILWCGQQYGVVVATEYGGGSTIRVMWCDGNTNDVEVLDCKKTGQSFVGVSDSLSYIDWLDEMLDSKKKGGLIFVTKMDKDEQDYEVLYDGTIKRLRIRVVRNENREWCIIETLNGNQCDVCIEDLSIITATLLGILGKFTGNQPATSVGPWRKEY